MMTPDIDTLDAGLGEQALMDLSVTLAHRIRSYVAGIEGYTDLLAETLATREQRDLAFRIMEGAQRIERVLSDLQVYGQPLVPSMNVISVGELMESTTFLLDDLELELLRIEMESVKDDLVVADLPLLRQALLALLHNAFDATDRRSEVRIMVQKSDDRLSVGVWNEGAIRVDGPAERIFVPFYTTKAQNLGIGLPVASRIVREHGGTLGIAENSEEKGTCFSINLALCSKQFATVLDL